MILPLKCDSCRGTIDEAARVCTSAAFLLSGASSVQPRERLISVAPDQASMHVAGRVLMALPHRLAIECAHRQLELDLLALAVLAL